MPVILHEKDEARWLDPDFKDTLKLSNLLAPYSAEEMEVYEVLLQSLEATLVMTFL